MIYQHSVFISFSPNALFGITRKIYFYISFMKLENF